MAHDSFYSIALQIFVSRRLYNALVSDSVNADYKTEKHSI